MRSAWRLSEIFQFFFFNDTATTEIYTLSLHDALPISRKRNRCAITGRPRGTFRKFGRSEEHTSELQSRPHLVCRLLLEKKKIKDALLRPTDILQISFTLHDPGLSDAALPSW